jgi:hypothetical protein
VSLVGLASILFSSPAQAIIRRHDVADNRYIVEAEDYPALVDLLAPGDCIATLISPSWLITAAHCAELFRLPATLTIGGQSMGVDSVKLPSTWQDDRDDIALIKLSSPVGNVDPIGVYRGSDEIGKQVWFIGRGDTNTGLNGQSGAAVDGKTRKASNTIIAADSWWIEFIFNSPTDTEVTDLEGISGDGDSGGPALIETEEGLQIVGLSSYQDEGNNSLGTYGVHEFYTRVSKYEIWMNETMNASGDGEEESNTQPVEESETGTPSEGSGSGSEISQLGGERGQVGEADCGCNALPMNSGISGIVWLGGIAVGWRRKKRAIK